MSTNRSRHDTEESTARKLLREQEARKGGAGMSTNAHYRFAEPKYGFEWGPAKVTRMAHIEGRYHVMAVDTPYRHVQIGVSPTGRAVRVWIDGVEAVRE